MEAYADRLNAVLAGTDAKGIELAALDLAVIPPLDRVADSVLDADKTDPDDNAKDFLVGQDC